MRHKTIWSFKKRQWIPIDTLDFAQIQANARICHHTPEGVIDRHGLNLTFLDAWAKLTPEERFARIDEWGPDILRSKSHASPALLATLQT